MKQVKLQLGAVGFILASLLAVILPVISVTAQPLATPDISISRFRVSTDGQFFELHNNSPNEVEKSVLSRVQLAYYNHYDITKATSSKFVSLGGSLPANGYYLINDSNLALCYQMTVASASLGFSSTNGMVQLLHVEQEYIGGPFVSKVLDSVAWSRTAVTSSPEVQILPKLHDQSFLQKEANSWREYWPSDANPCEYVWAGDPTKVAVTDVSYVFLGSAFPPVRHVAAVSKSSSKINRNVGKMAPVVNELLPNPASPQTDADDEFIELYNPNDSNFDLSGFKLAFGSKSPRKYTFPEGTVLKPKQFRAFTSGDTSISLSNTEAQVWLLDPNEQVISQSEPYAKAKDGQAWALDNGKWVWTSNPSPNEMNTISPTGGSTGDGKSAAAVLGITDSKSGGSGGGTTGTGSANQLDDAAPLHPSVLAVVGMAAVAYALYEYRHDIGNRIFQFRRYLRHRRTLGQEL